MVRITKSDIKPLYNQKTSGKDAAKGSKFSGLKKSLRTEAQAIKGQLKKSTTAGKAPVKPPVLPQNAVGGVGSGGAAFSGGGLGAGVASGAVGASGAAGRRTATSSTIPAVSASRANASISGAGNSASSRSKAPAGNVAVSLKPNTVELTLKRIDPFSAVKLGFFISIALGIIFTIAVTIFWVLLDTTGIIFQFTQAMIGSGLGQGASSFSGGIGVAKVAGVAGLLACLNVILSSLLALIIAAIYNVAASLSGGLKLHWSNQG
jgi:hypothetical protein